MDPVTASIVAGAAAPVIGGIAGNILGGGSRSAQEDAINNMLAQVQSIQAPEEKLAVLDRYKQAGILTPEMEQSILQSDTELGGIQIDPSLREAQMGALAQLQSINEAGGLTLQDRARLNQALGEIQQAERGSRDAAMQSMRRRGMGGSGAELAAALSAGQAAATRGSQEALNIEGMAQQRALESLMSQGALGGQIRGQEFGEQAEAAKAQDLINQFNIANRSSVQQRNVGSKNQAQAANLAAQQDIMNRNVDVGNQQYMYNLQAPQRQFENQMQKAGAAMPAYGAQADMYGQRAQQTANMWSGIGQGVGQGAMTYGLYGQKSPQTNLSAGVNKNIGQNIMV